MPLPDGELDVPLANCAPRDGGGLIDVKVFTEFMNGLKAHPSRVTVSIIAGLPVAPEEARYRLKTYNDRGMDVLDLDPICSSAVGTAEPAVRLQAFAASLGGNGSLDSICTDNLQPALTRIGNLIASRMNAASHCPP